LTVLASGKGTVLRPLIRVLDSSACQKLLSVAWFYEIRNSDNAVLKRNGGFANQDAAKEAARAGARQMKSAPKPIRPDVARILVGQNTEKPTR
jgi:hypothetical protein